ncbi:MAG: hypothetical protein ACREF4_18230 [Gammaproteobacteria bacterium]
MKAVSIAWFQRHKHSLAPGANNSEVEVVDAGFRELLALSEKAPSTTKVRAVVKRLQSELVRLDTSLVSSPPVSSSTTDAPPTFAAVPDPVMRQVLTRRWQECVTCLAAGAPLAATVMMGGLLESLFLARVNREPNKQPIFTAKAAPKDSKTQQALSLREWTLADYIAVAHELRWIPQSVRDVSEVVRDYRNYIHPQKELTHQIALTVGDARMFWEVSKAISSHILRSNREDR